MSRAAWMLLALPLIAAPQPVLAQGERPGWLPRQIEIGGGLTAAQRATAVARLEQIERILLQVPELARPEGFEVKAQFYGGSRKLGPGGTNRADHVVEYMLRLWFFRPSREATGGQGCTCLTIAINSDALVGMPPIRDQFGREVYIEAKRGALTPLATQVYEGLTPDPDDLSIVYVLLTSGGELPWKAVTREEFYRATVFDLEGKDGAKLADFRTSLQKTPYQEWVDAAAQRRKEREEVLAMAATMQTPAEVAQLRKMLEDTEREVTERLRASEATDREGNQQALKLSYGFTDAIHAELETMTAAERSMPALVDMTLPDGPSASGWRLTNRDAPTAWRVLSPNYDFFRARRSPVEVRDIMVHISARGSGAHPVIHNVLWQTFQKLDWAALNRLLDVPR